MKEALPLRRNRDFVLLWSGQVVSTLGSEVSGLAFPLLVLSLTGSPAQAGVVGFARALPYLLVYLPAGALVDRWNRKRVMLISDAGRALALGSLAIEYGEDAVTVHDLLHERTHGHWHQRVSSYRKLRLHPEWVAAQVQALHLLLPRQQKRWGYLQLEL